MSGSVSEVPELTTVDRLALSHAPSSARSCLLLDPSPALAAAAVARFESVVAWCDDVRSVAVCAAAGVGVVDEPVPADVALCRLPGSLAALEFFAGSMAAAGVDCFVGSAAVKHMTLRQNAVLARYFGDVHATRGVGKYRGLVGFGPVPGVSVPAPATRVDAETGLTLVASGPVFGGASVDAGTRLLLSTSSRWPVGDAVDVGCGNGTISAVLAQRGCSVTSVDVSREALRSTAATLAANGLPEPSLVWGDGLSAPPDQSADLIVTNPPFHVGPAKDSSPTLAFLRDAPRVLRPGGELWVVFNSHLPYVSVMRDVFGQVDVVARDRAFTVANSFGS